MPTIIEITDFSAPELDVYARYSEVQLLNRHEPEKGIFIAESPKVIGRALECRLRSGIPAPGAQTRGGTGEGDHQPLR